MTRKDGGHCGCCTYLSFMDPVLHSIVSEHGAKLDIPGHCGCCRYLRSKGVHDDITEARKYRRASPGPEADPSSPYIGPVTGTTTKLKTGRN